jgi:hypothetical protein
MSESEIHKFTSLKIHTQKLQQLVFVCYSSFNRKHKKMKEKQFYFPSRNRRWYSFVLRRRASESCEQ